jgi:S-adenosylmethionine/arginine decarboxylase-like enzyme
MVNYWGWHLIVNLKECSSESIRSEDNFKNFLNALVKRINMVAYGEPLIKHFATHDPDKAGYSIVQLIETSNITGHFVDKNGDGYLDVFSCSPFEPDHVLAVIREYFAPLRMQERLIFRQAA